MQILVLLLAILYLVTQVSFDIYVLFSKDYGKTAKVIAGIILIFMMGVSLCAIHKLTLFNYKRF